MKPFDYEMQDHFPYRVIVSNGKYTFNVKNEKYARVLCEFLNQVMEKYFDTIPVWEVRDKLDKCQKKYESNDMNFLERMLVEKIFDDFKEIIKNE